MTEIAARAIGPNLPHFYGAIGGGLDAAGNPFMLINTNGMMGALGGERERDGTDVGGHYWIPEGIAYNVEDLEDQYPILYLYRRLLPVGARRRRPAARRARVRRGDGSVEQPVHPDAPVRERVVRQGPGPARRQPGQPGVVPDAVGDRRAGASRSRRGAAGLRLDRRRGARGRCSRARRSTCRPGSRGSGCRRRPQGGATRCCASRRDVAARRGSRACCRSDDARAGLRRRGPRRCRRHRGSARLAVRRERLGGDGAGRAGRAPAGAARAGELLHVVDGRWWCNGADLGPADGSWKAKRGAPAADVRRARLPSSAAATPEMAGEDHAARVVLPGHRLPARPRARARRRAPARRHGAGGSRHVTRATRGRFVQRPFDATTHAFTVTAAPRLHEPGRRQDCSTPLALM